MPPVRSPLSPCQRHVAGRGRCRSVTVLQEGTRPRRAGTSRPLSLRVWRLGLALPPAAAAPQPYVLPGDPLAAPPPPPAERRRHRRAPGGARPKAAGLFSSPNTLLPVGFWGVWGGFFSQYTGLGVGFFFSMNGPKNQDGTNISELVEFNQPLTLVLIKAEIRTAGTVTPRVTITAP